MPKSKKWKDPNKPKGVKSAYIFFVESERAEQESAGIQLPFSEFSKKCGAAWGEMDDEEKEQYVKMSENDRKRHEAEMRNYQPPPPPPRNSDSDSDDDGGASRRKKKKKDPNAPKRNITAYFFFAAHVRPEIRSKNPGMAVTEVATLIGQKWQKLNNEDKRPFEVQARQDKERYENQMESYTKTGRF